VNLDLPNSYQGLTPYFGDIHNHCGISYGHGSIEDAYANARLQLDFASVTGHAYWHDMPRDEDRLRYLVDYHEQGFARLAKQWDHVQDLTEQVHEDGRFVTFLSFEWHSMKYGDHCVYYNGPRGGIIRADSLEELRSELRTLAAAGVQAMAIPHHIGYRRGRRGIDWDYFTEEFSPVVEMMSMHGCGEHDDAPRPYLHTMGPREHASSVVAGLRRGYRFGLIGSTDHHSAHPGSHGHGRLAVWAPELSRQSIWDAVQARRTYALTGDRIVLGFELDGVPMGSAAAPSRARAIEVAVDAGAPLDYVEVVRNGDVIHRAGPGTATVADAGRFAGLVEISMGWGERGTTTQWDVELEVVDGSLDRVEPRFRGDDIVAPSEDGADSGHFSSWERTGDRSIRLRTRTRGNATTTTDGTQRMNLRIVGDDNTRIRGRFNGEVAEHTVGELRQGSRSGYIGGFVAPAFLFGRAVPDAEITSRISFVDEMPDDAERSSHDDWYYVRVRQRNDQWAWSSPIWVQRTT
jgi:hypothetical protein